MEKIKISTNFKKGRISWGAIIGGVITVLAISILLSILSTSIGFYKLDPLSNEPASGVGTAVGIITVISLILSLACGGFVAGKLAGCDGVIHGFLVWATTTIVTVIMVVMLASGAVRLAGNVLGSVASVAGHAVSGVGSAIGHGASALGDQVQHVFGEIDFNSDADMGQVRQDVRQALRKSGVRELQPEYLEREYDAIRKDFSRSLRKLVTNPNDADKVIDGFTSRLEERTEKVTRNIDRNDLTRAIANNTNLTQAEVNHAVDEYIELYENAKEKGQEEIQKLQQNIEQARQDWEVVKRDALVEADRASNAAGTAALISFFALLVGAAICALTGLWGSRLTKEGYEA